MSSANLTMIGMYNFDNTLFDGLTLPTGIDKQTAVDEFLLKCGEFEVLYADIAFMKKAIEHWGKKHYRTFDKWVKALAIEFEPLYNYDRFEEYTDAKVSSGSSKSKGQSLSATGTQSDGTTGTQRDVSAYDSSDFEPREKESGTSGSTGSGSGIAMNEGSETTSGTEQIKHTAHLYGNIGVTTSSELLESYLKVERFNIYEQMADIFVDEFVIPVY